MLKLSRAQFNAAEEEIRYLKQELAQRDGRIEQLEAALRDIASGRYSGRMLPSLPPQDPAVFRARAALGEKKDG